LTGDKVDDFNLFLSPKQAAPRRSIRHLTLERVRSLFTLDDIISHSFSRWVGFWHRPKLTTSILHINVITSGGGNRCIRGLRDSGRGGLGSLGWRFLDDKLLPSKQKEIRNEINNNEERNNRRLP
jgi:hypothetical protein